LRKANFSIISKQYLKKELSWQCFRNCYFGEKSAFRVLHAWNSFEIYGRGSFCDVVSISDKVSSMAE
jgi:hypothetical protein